MIIAWYILFTIGCVAIFIGLFPKTSDTVSVFAEKVKKEKKSGFAPFLTPLAPLNKLLLKGLRAERPLRTKIDLAQWKISPGEFLAAKELLTLVIPLGLYIFGFTKLVWLIVIGLVSFFIPDIVLHSKVKKRKYSIARILPETVDLLGLCVGAGLDFMSAVRWVVDKVKVNPMVEELMHVLREMNVGRPRSEALKDMARRLNIPDVSSFVRTLVQADRMGTPVEEAFKILSEDTRMRRFHRGQRQAMKAPLKMLVPLVLCILPVILIIIAGPILVRFMSGNMFKGEM